MAWSFQIILLPRRISLQNQNKIQRLFVKFLVENLGIFNRVMNTIFEINGKFLKIFELKLCFVPILQL